MNPEPGGASAAGQLSGRARAGNERSEFAASEIIMAGRDR